jgi:nickel-dependent lactate racemase
MSISLQYGADASLQLEFANGHLLAECCTPRGTALADVAVSVRQALEKPLNFPPLAQAIVPGDRVTVAIEPGVPQAAQIVAGAVAYLMATGIEPSDITLLRTQTDVETGVEDPRCRLSDDIRERVRLETHEPAERGHLTYLAATPKGRPIYLNRTLCESDVVLPIGCLRCDPAISYHGVYSGLYPTFSDSKTLARFRNPHLVEPENEMRARARHEVDVVGWLAGTQFVMQVLPGGGESLLAVYAGEAETVFERGSQASNAVWHHQVPGRAELVICGISGGRAQQTWENVGRAIAAALRVVTEGGAVVLCTDLETKPGPAVQGLAEAESLAAALRMIGKLRPADTIAATELGTALERARVYLLSKLDTTFVEELGVAPIESPKDVARLALRSESCIVLANAQFAVATALAD